MRISETRGDMAAYSPASKGWKGTGSTAVVPPAAYWLSLADVAPSSHVARLRQLSDDRVTAFTPSALPPPEATAVLLLDRVAADGWVRIEERQKCSNCDSPLSIDEAAQSECPNCHEAFVRHGGVVVEKVYVRDLEANRNVEWVIAIHGMNTSGAWQEAFTWHLATTWGRSVPVAVYKYGIVIAGVILFWRRRKLQDNLRNKLATLRNEARAQGFLGNPDVIAHSFGTWLLGHLLEKELAPGSHEQLKFGRIILTGCVLRPDFDWGKIKAAGLVEDVLNHCGTKDPIVPLAHATIFDSGPSGRRGFDGNQVTNVRAVGFGHSDLFSIEKFVVNGRFFQKPTSATGELSHLEYAYKQYWKPFLTLPRADLDTLPDRHDPPKKWRQLPWLFRGTIFPILILPLILGGLLFGLARLGPALWATREIFQAIVKYSAAGLASLLVCIAINWLWRRCLNI